MWMCDRLNRKAEFLIADQTPNPVSGGVKQTYASKAKGIWAGVQLLKASRQGGGNGGESFVRDVQINDYATHVITVRKNVPMGIHIEHDGLIKSNHFIYIASNLTRNQGRLYRIITAMERSSTGIGEDWYYEIMVREESTLDRGSGLIS